MAGMQASDGKHISQEGSEADNVENPVCLPLKLELFVECGIYQALKDIGPYILRAGKEGHCVWTHMSHATRREATLQGL